MEGNDESRFHSLNPTNGNSYPALALAWQATIPLHRKGWENLLNYLD